MKRTALLSVFVAVSLLIAGCATAPAPAGQKKAPPAAQKKVPPAAQKNVAPGLAKGQVLVITGRVVLNKNQYSLQDQAGPTVFRFVGLKKAEEATLAALVGRVARIRLRVVSVESAKACTANFMEVAK